MARIPTMTPQEAERAIEREIGSRPINVTSANRAVVRPWFTANRIPSIAVGLLSLRELELAYNDTSGAQLERVRRKYEAAREAASDEFMQAAENEMHEARVAAVESSGAAQHEATGNGDAAALADLIRKLAGSAVDVAQVRQIVRDALKDHEKTIRIELVRQDGTAHKIEGHVHPKLETLIRAMSARQANGKHPNIMLVGPTGSGKTHAVEQAAQALGKEFYSNGAISMDHQLIGFKDAAGNYHETPLRKAFSRPATYLFDEIDSSDNSPLLCLAGALANSGFTFPDAFVERHPDSVIIAAGNTWGLGATADFVGRNKLDGAIRSRFPIRIMWDYDESLEREICGNVDWARRVQAARAKARAAGLKVIIDPRMSQAGAALIAAGMDADQAAELTYLADLSADQRRMIEA